MTVEEKRVKKSRMLGTICEMLEEEEDEEKIFRYLAEDEETRMQIAEEFSSEWQEEKRVFEEELRKEREEMVERGNEKN